MRGNVDQLRTHRIERKDNDGRIVIQEPGGRMIVRDGGRVFIRHDESERFRHFGGNHRFEERGRERFDYVGRPGGYQIITVTDHNGRMLRRIRRGPDGREVVLINNAVVGAAVATGFILALAAPQILIPRERYIVDVAAAPPALLYETLDAPPVMPIERAYTLDEIRYNVNLRDRVRRIDLTAITFELRLVGARARAVSASSKRSPRHPAGARSNPDAVFMIEGHTDAVGADVDNLSLSDRRAESVAVVLTEQFQIPPENLVTQGYGEQFLKVPTEGPNRENRRVAVRNIAPLLAGRERHAEQACPKRAPPSGRARFVLVYRLCRRDVPGFPAQHRALAGQAPVIAGELAALAEHAVARHHEGERVLADRGADRARGLRRADLARDVRIGRGAAHRDLQQRLPDPHLEIGADQHDAQRPVGAPQRRDRRCGAPAARCARCPRHSAPSASGCACRRAPPSPRRHRRRRGRRARARSP